MQEINRVINEARQSASRRNLRYEGIAGLCAIDVNPELAINLYFGAGQLRILLRKYLTVWIQIQEERCL